MRRQLSGCRLRGAERISVLLRRPLPDACGVTGTPETLRRIPRYVSGFLHSRSLQSFRERYASRRTALCSAPLTSCRPGRRARATLAALLVWVLPSAACGPGASDAPTDAAVSPLDADAPSADAVDAAAAGGEWVVASVVSDLPLEGPLRLIQGPGDTLFAAALRPTGTAPGCTLAEPPGPVTTYEAVLLTGGSTAAWAVETVAAFDGGFGLALGLAENAQDPLVAFMGGTPGEEFCGGSDLLVAARDASGRFTSTAVQTTSAVAGVVCSAMQDVCNTGDVTGMNPALGADAAGRPLVAFRDVHFGYTKEDYDSSDLEVARREAGAWRLWTVDDSSGAAQASAVASDSAAGRSYVAYTVPKAGEVRLATLADDQWTRETVAEGAFLRYAPALVVEADGRPAMALFDADTESLWYARRAADGSWGREPVDIGGRGGFWPSAARGPDGLVRIAYYRCGRLGSSACAPSEDGVRVARRTATGFAVEALPADAEAEDGLWPALAYGGDGQPRVLFAARRFDPVSGQAVVRLQLATWRGGP